NDPGDLRLIDLRRLRVRALDLDELAGAKLAGRRDDDLEVALLDGRGQHRIRGRRGRRPFVPGDRPADDENGKKDRKPASTQLTHSRESSSRVVVQLGIGLSEPTGGTGRARILAAATRPGA